MSPDLEGILNAALNAYFAAATKNKAADMLSEAADLTRQGLLDEGADIAHKALALGARIPAAIVSNRQQIHSLVTQFKQAGLPTDEDVPLQVVPTEAPKKLAPVEEAFPQTIRERVKAQTPIVSAEQTKNEILEQLRDPITLIVLGGRVVSTFEKVSKLPGMNIQATLDKMGYKTADDMIEDVKASLDLRSEQRGNKIITTQESAPAEALITRTLYSMAQDLRSWTHLKDPENNEPQLTFPYYVLLSASSQSARNSFVDVFAPTDKELPANEDGTLKTNF